MQQCLENETRLDRVVKQRTTVCARAAGRYATDTLGGGGEGGTVFGLQDVSDMPSDDHR